jgi:hypothetical protein
MCYPNYFRAGLAVAFYHWYVAWLIGLAKVQRALLRIVT